ncbi:2-isopropylmalate synthase [Sorangium atrum]|uniref:2-isopropylmalate synthase n=1 Tax=Sorangium atrum TaxID=2995308 RepID=A0ABT5C213_9BACT|nr:2-isopropylmalate synthase [Sorangium aterium]MDC0679222.1 2-isopropylmalate synthase [Sorangium aterium]
MSADGRDPGAAAPFDWNRAEPAPGERPPRPGGRMSPSGGQPSPSGGQPLPSGGQQPPSGGQLSPSGGQQPPSGGLAADAWGAARADGEAWLPFGRGARPVEVLDETLRDGIQGVSTVNPPRARKIELLHAMASVGVDVVNLGMPATGPRQFDDACLLAREIVASRLPLGLTAAARTLAVDVQEVARVAERTGAPIMVYAFIGSSPIRHFVEGWGPDFLARSVDEAGRAAAAAGLPFCLVAEDATRSPPDMLRTLFRAAVDAGAARLCLCDTTGHVTPPGVEALVAFARRELGALGATGIELDWHGHNDRGLGLAAALWAVASGIERVHATALGVGERTGNTCLELLVDNLGRLGARPPVPRERLAAYCAAASRALAWPVAPDHPIAGALSRRG